MRWRQGQYNLGNADSAKTRDRDSDRKINAAFSLLQKLNKQGKRQALQHESAAAVLMLTWWELVRIGASISDIEFSLTLQLDPSSCVEGE